MSCHRCPGCTGKFHHWRAEVEDAKTPTYTHGCQHCYAVGIECSWCEGSGLTDEEEDTETLCDLCHGEGVCFVTELAICASCDTRLSVPPQHEDLYCRECANG